MAEDEHPAPKGLFEGTIFEGGLFGKGHAGHAHPKPDTWYEYIEHTKLGGFVFEYLAEWGISRAVSLSVAFIGLLFVLNLEIPHLFTFAVEWLVGTAPVWLPVGLVIMTWNVWIWYIQGLYISGRDPVLLEFKVPREITKSPRAMELALGSLYTTSGEGSFLHRIWHGQVRPWYSLEYVSFAGEVHMYIWCWKNYRRVVEAAFYAQYPEIEIHQVEDYASKFKYDGSKHSAFVNEHALVVTDALPIKTYIEFELDKDPKEEFKIDPMAQAFEFLSSLAPGEQAWIQVIFRATGNEGGTFSPQKGVKKWKARVAAAVADIRKQASLNPDKEEAPESDERKYGFPRPTWAQTEQMRIMERQLSKIPFDVAIKGIFIADTTKTPMVGSVANGMRWFWKSVGNPGYLNELQPTRGHNSIDYPWQDFMGFRDRLLTARYIDAYRRRSAFFAPWRFQYGVMTTESLATMFHFPSSGVSAPGLERIPATKAEPPANLPK